MSDPRVYDEDYFLRGKESGKSLYTDYRWLPELTLPMCKAIAEHLGLSTEDQVLDFGCSRGYIVKAFHRLGYCACGVDVSEWAVANCDPQVTEFVGTPEKFLYPEAEYEWIIAKDVLEHVEEVRLTVHRLMTFATTGMFVVVPLAYGKTYDVPEYEKDVTHLHRLTLAEWAAMFMRPGWSVEARYRLQGVKDNYAQWERGNGFITARRLKPDPVDWEPPPNLQG